MVLPSVPAKVNRYYLAKVLKKILPGKAMHLTHRYLDTY
jgi:hypothetical protein